MKNLTLLILLTCTQFTLSAQTTLRVTSIPINTPLDTRIYAVGDFNDWDYEDLSTLMTRQTDGTYTLKIKVPEIASIDYKFHRGSRKKVEGKQDGSPCDRHLLLYTRKPESVDAQIAGWENEPSNTTADANVRVLFTDFSMPQLNRKRRIWIYLPPNYDKDASRRFPVLYMHEGQHIFSVDAAGKDEWKIDETLNALAGKGDRGCIVVGIDGQGTSASEFTPWLNLPNSEGRAYADFIVTTLKPWIDGHFRTKSDRTNTGIGGSMMAGSAAMFIAAEYQNVFSKALICSPTFSYSDSCFAHIKQRGKKKTMRYYIVSGSDEDVSKTVAIEKMAATLKSIGHNFEEVKVVKKIDGEPTEWFWAREFAGAYKWLFRDMAPDTDEGIFDNAVKINTNESNSVLMIESNKDLSNANIEIFDVRRKLLSVISFNPKKNVDISFLEKGDYFLHCIRGEDVLFVKRFVKSR
jgi:predicted alpha/beta superfamily hydrolase